MINEEIQLFRITQLLRDDLDVFVLNKNTSPEDCNLKIHPEYDINNIMNNIRENSFPRLFNSLEIILNDIYINRSTLYKNLLNYRFLNYDDAISIIGYNVRDRKMEGQVGWYKESLFSDNPQLYIYINEEHHNNIIGIVHEMYHFAAARSNKEGGFAKKEEGIGIDEGFTQYLTILVANNGEEIHESPIGHVVSYPFSTSYAKSISELIGFNKMKELYFYSGYDGLVEELSKYSGKYEAISFLRNLDYICKCETKNKNSYDIENFNDAVSICNSYLTWMWEELRPNEVMDKHFLVGISDILTCNILVTDKVAEEIEKLKNKKERYVNEKRIRKYSR